MAIPRRLPRPPRLRHPRAPTLKLPPGIASFRDHYRASVTVNGRRERQVVRTVEEGKLWQRGTRKRLLDEDARGEPERGNRPDLTYGALIPDLLAWYASGVRRVYSLRTLEGYKLELRRIGEWWAGRRVARTRLSDMDDLVARLRKLKLSTSTIKHHLDRVSALHELAVRKGYIDRIPCPVERPAAVELSPPRPMGDTDLRKLLGAAAKDWDRRVELILLLSLDAGLRRQEIAQLRGDDILLHEGLVRVASRGETKGRTKSGRPRDLPILTSRLRAALEAAPRVAGASLLGLRSGHGVQGRASRAWRTALGGKAQLHVLRHTFATRAEAAGFTPGQIQVMLGHGSVTTTQRYLHPDPRIAPADVHERFEMGASAIPGPQLPRIRRATGRK